MTVQTNTTVATGIGNGVTSVFPIPFKFNKSADLVVYLIDEDAEVEIPLVLNSDYTVSGAGNENGGSLTMLAGPVPVGKAVVARRIVDLLQLTDLRNQGRFFAEVHEDVFDKLMMINQQQQTQLEQTMMIDLLGRWDARGRRIVNLGPPLHQDDAANKKYVDGLGATLLSRVLRTPEIIPSLPGAEVRSGMLLGFDSEGNPTVAAPASGSAEELAMRLADAENPALGSALIGRGVIATDSISTLLSLPEIARRKDLRYFVKGYHAGSDMGGGTFYYDPLRSDENDGGIVLNGFVRLLDGSLVTPEMFGAVADGIEDDTAALLRVFQAGKPIYLGSSEKTYRITSEIEVTATSSVIVHSDGAKVVVDSPENIRSAIRIELAGHGLYVSGRWHLDCQLKSYSGFHVRNFGATVAEADVVVAGVRINNCRRAGTAFVGGDGLFCAGRLGQVLIDDVVVDTVRLAPGAGIPGSQGVAGIVVARDNSDGWDARHVNITNCSVMRIYSDDPSYSMDQDGIKIFTSYNSSGVVPRPVYASIRGCYFLNCHGRAIKIQTEFCDIESVKIDRNSDIYSNFIGNPDIDFQVGGGRIRGVSAYYRSSAPSRFANFSLTRSASRANPVSVEVSGVNVMQVGSGNGVERMIAVRSEYSSEVFVNISGVTLEGGKVPSNLVTIQGADTSGWLAVNISGAKIRASDAVVRRLGSATPAWITGASIMNSGASVPFAQATNPEAFNATLIGNNRLVT